MKVFKFGGASVRDAEAVKNVFRILSKFPDEDLCIVFSAMGKTTNALEKVAEAWMKNDAKAGELLTIVSEYHLTIAHELDVEDKIVLSRINELKKIISEEPPSLYDKGYDRVVSYGELISTSLISEFLKKNNYSHELLDARDLITTDCTYRNGVVYWEKTADRVHNKFNSSTGKLTKHITITQGFIGSDEEGNAVTLGREGSDFSAAIFAWALNAEAMIIWKDVPGVLNADPRYFENTVKLNRMTYRDAIELAYYGASVIHPKTIQPLQSKNIPLHVKSFYFPDEPGTLISSLEEDEQGNHVPSFIFKPNQVLISISPRDFSFIAEGNLHGIFGLLSSANIHLNMMQHSAISFSMVMDNNQEKIDRLFKGLGDNYRVRYNDKLQLITIRYYDQATIDKVVNDRVILLEQKSRTTVQLVVESGL